MNRRERQGIDDATAIKNILHQVDPSDALIVLTELRQREGLIQGIDGRDDYSSGFWSFVDDEIGEDDDDDGNGDEDIDDQDDDDDDQP